MKNILSLLYIIWITYEILRGCHTWFTVEITNTTNIIISSLGFLTYLLLNDFRVRKLSNIEIILICIIYISPFFGFHDWNLRISNLFYLLPIYTIINLKTSFLYNVIYYIEKAFAIIISISLSLYFIDKLGISIPTLGFAQIVQYPFWNYILYIDVITYEGAFSAFCLEPGFFSLLSVCLLMINQFNFKKSSTYIYIISIIVSLSLGGYILAIIGYYLCKNSHKTDIKKIITNTLFFLFILLIIIIISFNYNNGNNIIVDEILSRLAYDEDKGIAGNNRENLIASTVISSIFFSKQVWLGIGREKWLSIIDGLEGFDASSYRIFVVIYGAIYTIALFLIINKYSKINGIYKTTLPFICIFWLDFIQHGDPFSGSIFLLVLFIEYTIRQNKDLQYR